MLNSENEKVSFLIRNSFRDRRSIICKNFDLICKAWRTESDLEYICANIDKFSILHEADKFIVKSIRDFKGLIDGEIYIENFTDKEAYEILNWLSTI